MNNDGIQNINSAKDDGKDTSNHDQVMAHFQEITNFYDMEQCLAILESTQWNLDQAIQSFYNGGGLTEQMDEDLVHIDNEPLVIPDASANTGSSSFPISSIMSQTKINNESLGIFGSGVSINSQIRYRSRVFFKQLSENVLFQ